MEYVVAHPTFVFLCFTFPLAGWIIYRSLSRKLITTILYVSLALLLPALTGYTYILDNAYGYLVYITAAFGYALMNEDTNPKIWPTIIFSVILFLICGFMAFIGGMGGSISVAEEWHLKDYKIEHRKDQGFAGHPRLTYELSRYAIIPLFIKHIDTGIEDTTNTCWIKFTDAKFNFNRCQPDSSHTTP